MKITKHKIKFIPEYNFLLFGIVSYETSYRLCWKINNALNINLCLTNKLEISQNNHINTKQSFIVYTFEDKNKNLKYNLITNKLLNNIFIKELSKIDYLLQIFGEITEKQQKEILYKLKQIPDATAVFIFDPKKLKSKQKLLF